MRLPKAFVDIGLLALSIAAAAIVFEDAGILRTLMATLLIFVLPGFSTLMAWFPDRAAKAPDNILLSIALSLAITGIGGIVLNFLPGGLQAQTWALWLSGITVFNAGAVLLRDIRKGDTFTIGNELAFRFPQIILLVLAGALVFGALAVARTGVIEQPRPSFTQLWLLEDTETNTMRLGLRNEEHEPLTYWLVVEQDGLPLQTYYDLQVGMGEVWETTIPLPANSAAPVEANLYLADAPQDVYRHVSLRLSSNDASINP